MSQKAQSLQTDLQRPFKVMEQDHTLPWAGGKGNRLRGWNIYRKLSELGVVEFPKILIDPEGKSGDVVCIPRKSKENGISALVWNPRNSGGRGIGGLCHQWILALPHCGYFVTSCMWRRRWQQRRLGGLTAPEPGCSQGWPKEHYLSHAIFQRGWGCVPLFGGAVQGKGAASLCWTPPACDPGTSGALCHSCGVWDRQQPPWHQKHLV